MAQIKNTYLGALRTESIHLKSANRIITDAPVDNHGKGEAFSPTDLVCGALASCQMTVMGIVAEREGIDLSGLSCGVEKIMAANPRRIAEIVITYQLPNIALTDRQRELLKHAALTCPVAQSLSAELKQSVHFNF